MKSRSSTNAERNKAKKGDIQKSLCICAGAYAWFITEFGKAFHLEGNGKAPGRMYEQPKNGALQHLDCQMTAQCLLHSQRPDFVRTLSRRYRTPRFVSAKGGISAECGNFKGSLHHWCEVSVERIWIQFILPRLWSAALIISIGNIAYMPWLKRRIFLRLYMKSPGRMVLPWIVLSHLRNMRSTVGEFKRSPDSASFLNAFIMPNHQYAEVATSELLGQNWLVVNTRMIILRETCFELGDHAEVEHRN